MEKRKIVGFGRSSLIVSLPREWAKMNNVAKGDEIYVNYEGENLLITKKLNVKNKPEKICTIETDNDMKLTTIHRRICAKYINNFNIIEVNGGGVTKFSKEIKEYLRNLMVFEILEESKNKIVAKDFLELETIEPEKIIQRIYIIIRSILEKACKEIKKNDLDDLEEKEITLNSYFFLMQRYARFHLSNIDPKKDHLRIFDYWQMAQHLEESGNQLKRIVQKAHQNQLWKNENIIGFFNECRNYLSLSMDTLLQKDIKKISKVSEARDNMLRKMEELNFEEYGIARERIELMVKNIHRASRVILNLIE